MNAVKHRARKRFGQNFLQDNGIIYQIIQVIQPKSDDTLVEIGPGLGALTHPLLKCASVIAVEIDRDLSANLSAMPDAKNKLTIINQDALSLNFCQWGEGIRIIGNLPYNISTPLLFHLLQYTKCIKDMHFMLQKEVADRIAASPGSKNYGRLSVMLQYYCQTSLLFDVPPESFFPKPKVNSAIIRLTPHITNPFEKVDYTVLENVTAKAFAMRRKTIFNNLKQWISLDDLKSLSIDPQQRPEQLTIAEFVRLAKFLQETRLGKVVQDLSLS